MTNHNATPFDTSELKRFEESLKIAVADAGKFVRSRFMGNMQVDSKSKRPGKDLVTDVDKKSQEIIEGVMSKRHSDHQLLGEEDQKSDIVAKDIVWSVDPIDGTHNFINQSATYAVSAGILYRGVPIAGAVWHPWPSAKDGSQIISAHLGGGAYKGKDRLQVTEPSHESGRPVSGKLTALPDNARRKFRFSPDIRGHVGDVRVTGCASQELMHVATGIYQFSIVGAAAVWDFAAAAIIVQESGGKLLVAGFDGRWSDFEGWGGPYENDAATYERMRKWLGLMCAAHPKTADYLKTNAEPKGLSMLQKLAMRLAKR